VAKTSARPRAESSVRWVTVATIVALLAAAAAYLIVEGDLA